MVNGKDKKMMCVCYRISLKGFDSVLLDPRDPPRIERYPRKGIKDISKRQFEDIIYINAEWLVSCGVDLDKLPLSDV